MDTSTMSSSAASNSESTPSIPATDTLKRKSDDVGWEYGELIDPRSLDRVKCKLCSKVVSGGIFRLKQHVARIKGNVASCTKSTLIDAAKCKSALEMVKKKKVNRRDTLEELRAEVSITGSENASEADVPIDQPHSLGPMDKFARQISATDSSLEARKNRRQQALSDSLFKSRTKEVHTYFARWVYESGIPFNAINNDAFHQFIESVGQFGPGYLPPTQYQLREPLLKEAVQNTKDSMKTQEDEWKKSGCSVMTDAWSDRKRRSIMNLCVNCKLGTSFLSSIESSMESHTGKYIFDYVEKWINEIGPKNVIQVVTDNASNNGAAAKLLKQKRPNIFWTYCATHTINLILEAIGNTPRFKAVIDKAKFLTIFIYSHHKTLALMRKYTQKRDIVRPGVTRFASAFLTMQSLLDKQENLKFMFLSKEWSDCKWSTPTSAKGIKAYGIIVSPSFWTALSMCVEIFKPLVRVLRLVDGDSRPSMGFVYGELKEAKKEIYNICRGSKEMYEPIYYIIDSRAKDRLDSPLHLAGYFLNPYYFYKDDQVQGDSNCMGGVLTCIEAFFPEDFEKQHLVCNSELLRYKAMEGIFSRKLAILGRTNNDDNFNPVAWWSNYGSETPNLQMMAMKILSLTSSSSGCERNWSAFEGIHTKKRNRLDAERLSLLVYVQFNSRLVNKHKRIKEKCDFLLANDAVMAQGWIVEGGDDDIDDEFQGSTTTRDDTIRELDEENFHSDDEPENDEEFVFGGSDQEYW